MKEEMQQALWCLSSSCLTQKETNYWRSLSTSLFWVITFKGMLCVDVFTVDMA